MKNSCAGRWAFRIVFIGTTTLMLWFLFFVQPPLPVEYEAAMSVFLVLVAVQTGLFAGMWAYAIISLTWRFIIDPLIGLALQKIMDWTEATE